MVELTTAHRLPSATALREFAEIGGLMSYQADTRLLFRRAAGFVDKILRGDRHAAAVDAAMPPELAAIEVVWGETDEGGDLLAAHAAELWQQGDEGEGEHRADAWHRGQARVTPREIGIGGDHLGEALVEKADIGLDPRQAALGEAPQHGGFQLGGLVLGG